jgi:hypothetical protein
MSSLTFQSLEEKVELTIPYEKALDWIAMPWAWRIGWLGAALGLTTAYSWQWLGMDPMTAMAMVIAGLFFEVGGFTISLLISLVRAIPVLRRPRMDFARDMDVGLGRTNEVVDWLRKFRSDERRRLYRCAVHAKSSMSYRLGALVGGIERLGLLPIVLALYFQFKDFKPGQFDPLKDINVPAGLCLLFLAMLYAIGWWLIRYKTQLDGYERLLEESLVDETELERRVPGQAGLSICA